ncbi:hypothetical protein POM88_026393 [Heracleum sosnowskyi]|uniref:BED-type domain-containing protein n=1 Tax=Heracleum sosnowskyi TaxID=360622 RepID=A0AAD8I716_9APIA|nr:hypothetical protein POM88_026393 [Heracleum sosnowskyi]
MSSHPVSSSEKVPDESSEPSASAAAELQSANKDSNSTPESEPDVIGNDDDANESGQKGDNSKFRSDVWGHFTKKKVDGNLKAICNYCKLAMKGDSGSGTTHLRNHYNKKHNKKPSENIRQRLLTSNFNKNHPELAAYSFSSEAAKNELAKMIIMHEYPISMMDHIGFRSCILRFIYVPCPHTKEVLADHLLDCLMDWNLDRKLSCLTVDNCTTNDAMIEILLEKLDSSSLIAGGSLFHMRCSAHILNLIVKDGLEVIKSGVEKIRDSVAYWTATPKREEKFEETTRQLREASIGYATIYNDMEVEDSCITREV